MRHHRPLPTSPFLIGLLASLPLIACGGSEPPPLPPAPPPPATASAAPAPAPTPAPVATPAPPPVAEAPPEPPKPKLNHRHPVVALFLSSLDSLELSADQKTSVDGIKADLAKHAEAAKEPHEKLEADVEAGVIAGKLDQAKIDADIRAMSAAAAATQTAMQDDMNRLHEVLKPEQRKKLIETAREKGKEMREHGMEMHEHGGMHGEHEHGDKGPHAGKGPGDEHEHGDKGGPHDGKGPGGEHEHGGPHDGKGMWEGPLDKLGEELSLTPDQASKLKAKVEALVKAQQAAMKNTMAAAEKHFAAVGTAFEGDKFDAKKAGVGSQAPDLVKAMASDRVQFVQAVLSVLTAEQRPKFLAHVQAHHADMD